jgi:outer membrane protein
MKNHINSILTVGLLISLSISAYLVFSGKKVKTGYVKNTDLYNGFSLKKELESKLEKVKNQRKTILDSLVMELKIASSEIQAGKAKDETKVRKFEYKKQQYLAKQQEFEEDTEKLAQQYSDQIWKQINQYVSDYGKDGGYEYIYGASGDGALMYALEDNDLTQEVASYINMKYSGDKK